MCENGILIFPNSLLMENSTWLGHDSTKKKYQCLMNKSKKTVNPDLYVFGAGLNKCIFSIDLLTSPPLTNDFFQVALKINELISHPFHDDLNLYWTIFVKIGNCQRVIY